MIRSLLTRLDLAQGDLRVLGGIRQHGTKPVVRHKMRAGARGQIPAARQDAHSLEVDLLIAADGVCHGRAALGKGRRVEDNVIIRAALLLSQLRQQVKHIGTEILHATIQTVERSIVPRGRERILRHIDRHDGRRSGCSTVETKCPGMREAIEHALSCGKLCRCAAVILLVEEKARLLTVDIVNIVQDTVFADRHMTVQVRLEVIERHKAGALLHPLFFPELDVVALVDRVDLLTAGTQRLQQEREQLRLAQLHTQREHLRDQDRAEAVDCQPRKPVRLAKNQAAIVKIRAHDRTAVIDRILDTPRPESLVKAIVRIA